MDESQYLTLHGVPTAQPTNPRATFSHQPLDGWTWNGPSREQQFAIENSCLSLHDAFERAILGRRLGEELSDLLVPQWLTNAGHSADCAMSAETFERLLNEIPVEARPEVHARLYLEDCRRLIGGVQEVWLQIHLLVGEFYRVLNALVPIQHSGAPPGGIIFHTGSQASAVWTFANMVYVRLYSLLDYNVKLLDEVRHLHTTFDRYPRMHSKNILYGQWTRLALTPADIQGTLLEDHPLVAEVATVRNHIIHNGLLDEHPRVYIRYEHGQIVEKFVLMPDLRAGRPVQRVNRLLFFAHEDKLNLRLPDLIDHWMQRQQATLNLALRLMAAR
ncbi:hypothetical protein [Deinococcus koreensis]|uniref:Uncharacterized protein n=1 Tax=Deinococcus koreensis TaxID=2054903 RepID=A0A2K3URJ4_9DEIO|nr:hypothetical protein [Deinococcus koreensis]PNY79172.1 hypothetical protein CVO96_20440 [Deinococcus koreensis]